MHRMGQDHVSERLFASNNAVCDTDGMEFWGNGVWNASVGSSYILERGFCEVPSGVSKRVCMPEYFQDLIKPWRFKCLSQAKYWDVNFAPMILQGGGYLGRQFASYGKV